MVIEYPTKDGVKYFADDTIYIRADNKTINEWCIINNYTLNEYTQEVQRFSNDGALAYQFFDVF